jgi:hypothetical protein
MVRAVFPTPPSPSTTNLYRVIFPVMIAEARREFLGAASNLWQEKMCRAIYGRLKRPFETFVEVV